jgi:hypothetical protein
VKHVFEAKVLISGEKPFYSGPFTRFGSNNYIEESRIKRWSETRDVSKLSIFKVGIIACVFFLQINPDFDKKLEYFKAKNK